ncbi:chondroitin sulfate synthase 1-like [Babylonia areolata]|uniref:chondroitin sulfate synthase 1-like n=1 Tax=Babylonia areolata TaxID=304850 RepID=UPI003FD5C0D8
MIHHESCPRPLARHLPHCAPPAHQHRHMLCAPRLVHSSVALWAETATPQEKTNPKATNMRVKWKRLTMDVLSLIYGYVLGRMVIVHNKPFSAASCKGRSGGDISSPVSRESPPRLDDTLMVGVMTSRHNLATRAAAIYATWGRDVRGLIVFYIGREGGPDSDPLPANWTSGSGEEPVQILQGLPVVELLDVRDDAYPPRAKCFAMLRHMFHSFGASFRWFLRADDDLYLRYDQMVQFLNSVDGSLPRYMGRPGIGTPEEKGHLGLGPGKVYCMGGPGVVLSPPTLRRLLPHLGQCARSTVTAHEDTELGRCVWRHVHLACTSHRQMKTLFYQNFKKGRFLSPAALPPEVSTALTVHPVKDPRAMFRLHVHFLQQRLQALHGQAQLLESQVNYLNLLVPGYPVTLPGKTEHAQAETSNGKLIFNRQKSVAEFVISAVNEVSIDQHGYGHLKKSEDGQQRSSESLSDNEMSDTLKRMSAAALDVLTEDNPVWTYAIFRKPHMIYPSKIHRSRTEIMNNVITKTLRTFETGYKFSKLSASKWICARYQTYTLPTGLQHVVITAQEAGFQSFLLTSRFEPLLWREESGHVTWTGTPNTNNNLDRLKAGKGLAENSQQGPANGIANVFRQEATSWPRLYVLVPLYGRHQMYQTFLNRLASAAANYPARVGLRVALFPDPLKEHTLSMKATQRKTTALDVTVLHMQAPFSRSAALNALSRDLSDDCVLIFIDVDLIITDGFLFRVALTVQPGQAYFPLMFSRYSPSTVCYRRDRCKVQLFDFSSDSGLWRFFSYGMVAVTAGDVRRAGGFNTDIVGWGKEDVDFCDRCMSQGIKIFRAPDVGMIHQFHNKSCDSKLPADQLRMCWTSRNAMIGSESQMTKMVLDLGL